MGACFMRMSLTLTFKNTVEMRKRRKRGCNQAILCSSETGSRHTMWPGYWGHVSDYAPMPKMERVAEKGCQLQCGGRTPS